MSRSIGSLGGQEGSEQGGEKGARPSENSASERMGSGREKATEGEQP